LTDQHAAQLHGDHARQSEPTAGRTYVAGIDLAGESEQSADLALSAIEPKRDAVIVYIAEVTPPTVCTPDNRPTARIVETYEWTGQKHSALYQTLVDILRNVWHAAHVTVDATGIGATVASFLEQTLGPSVVEKFVFTAPSKSALGYDLLASINAGRLKMYTQNADTRIAPTFWRQVRASRYDLRGNQLLNFYVPESEGHDDHLMGLALVNRAASMMLPQAAGTQIVQKPRYSDGQF
jgi:phage FluMu gp28-like protein